jgi:hypothetical protein
LDGDMAWARTCLFASTTGERTQLFHPKVAGGLALSLLPRSARHAVNRLGHRVSGAPGNAVFVEDYSGSVW